MGINRSKRDLPEFYRTSIEENEEAEEQPGKMWKSINDIMRRDKKSAVSRMIKVNGKDIKDSRMIAESFCNYFSNITNDFRSKVPSIKGKWQ